MIVRSATVHRFAILLVVAAISGCTGIQSALDPHGPAASSIANIAWIMFSGAGVVFLLVVGLLAYGLWRSPAKRPALNANAFIIGGGVLLPVITLSALLVYALFAQRALVTAPDEPPLVIEVIGHQWWWELHYREGERSRHATTANELRIPAGRPVELQLKSDDVIHTFWVPSLAGKRDMIPGHTNTLYLEADEPGVFRGQCNEFCGAQHALMSLHVVSEPAAVFEKWLQEQREPARAVDTTTLQAGEQVFMASGCALCHSIRGTEARGRTAPDLTHFASRDYIAAATLRNTQANRIAWIVSAQHIKPESNMPNFDTFDGEQLRALAAYLGSLE